MRRIPTKGFSLAFATLLGIAANPLAHAQFVGTAEGTAYRLDDGAAAYREVHMLFESGGRPARLVLYRCMDGTAFARKIVVERSGAATPDFDFIDGRSGYREGVRTTANGREVYWQKSASTRERKKALDVPANAVIDAGFDAMVRAQWTRVSKDPGINTTFLLPSAQRFLKVSIAPLGDDAQAGVTRLRMKLDTWYGFVAPDTDIDYRSSDRRLLRYRGIGSIRDRRGRNQAVRIEFPGGLHGRQSSAAEIASAQRLPLNGQCGG